MLFLLVFILLIIWNIRELSLSKTNELIECGYSNYISLNKTLNNYINFYILVLIFLIFDLELILLYLIFVNISYLNYITFIIILYTIYIIIIGIIYEIDKYNILYNI